VALTPTNIAGLDGFDPLEGQLKLGASVTEGSGQRFVITRSQKGGSYDRLFIDSNHDGSIDHQKLVSCQPSQIRGKWWSNFSSSVQVKQNLNGTVIWQDYPLSFWVVVERPDETPQEIRFSRRGFLTGTVHIDGADYDVVLSDGNKDGLFGVGDFWTIQPVDAMAPSTSPRRLPDFAWINGAAYKLELADSTGTKGWIVRHDPGISQAEDEQARDPYREDRAAPRAASPVAFRQDVEQAIAEAKTGKTPYFLDFATSWCGPCKQMDQLVYTAQAVVDATKGIICIKIDGDQRRDLVELHQIRGYPTGILFGPEGREMARFLGYRNVRQMVAFLRAGSRPLDDMPAFIARVDTLRRDKSWSALEEEATAWIAGHPDDAQGLRHSIAARLVAMPDPQAKRLAERLFREMLATDPNSSRALGSLAELVDHSGRIDEAIGLYRKVLTMDPGNVLALNNLAWLLGTEKRQYEEALSLTTKALPLAPAGYADLLDTHGFICLRLKRFDEAQKYLRDAVRSMPPASSGAVITRYHLAEVCEAMGQNTEAADLFQRSLNLHNGIGGLTSEQASHAQEFLRQHPSSLLAAGSGATISGTEGNLGQPSSETPPVEADKLLRGTWGWDIDRGDDQDRAAVDLWWEHVTARERYLVPRNGAQLAVIQGKPFAVVTGDDLRKAAFTGDRISASDDAPTIDVGTILAVRTTEGNLVKMEVLGFDPLEGRRSNAKYNMRLRYAVYGSGSSPSIDRVAAKQGQTRITLNAGSPAPTDHSVLVNDAKLYESFQTGLIRLIEDG
jgi:Tfp pilus assembly protein PilF/thiol-disulfide isomerase/thioredoxin